MSGRVCVKQIESFMGLASVANGVDKKPERLLLQLLLPPSAEG